jgi:hypothetical protein
MPLQQQQLHMIDGIEERLGWQLDAIAQRLEVKPLQSMKNKERGEIVWQL